MTTPRAGTVGFPPGGDLKDDSEGISGHAPLLTSRLRTGFPNGKPSIRKLCNHFRQLPGRRSDVSMARSAYEAIDGRRSRSSRSPPPGYRLPQAGGAAPPNFRRQPTSQNDVRTGGQPDEKSVRFPGLPRLPCPEQPAPEGDNAAFSWQVRDDPALQGPEFIPAPSSRDLSDVRPERSPISTSVSKKGNPSRSATAGRRCSCRSRGIPRGQSSCVQALQQLPEAGKRLGDAPLRSGWPIPGTASPRTAKLMAIGGRRRSRSRRHGAAPPMTRPSGLSSAETPVFFNPAARAPGGRFPSPAGARPR